jgi:cobalt-zinc-cadmium efflux system outer membrane protein
MVRRLPLLGLLLVVGCLYPVNERIDATVCDLAFRPRDVQPPFVADQAPTPAPAEKPATLPAPAEVTPAVYQEKKAEGKGGGKGFEKEPAEKGAKTTGKAGEDKFGPGRLKIPEELLPGGAAPSLESLLRGPKGRRLTPAERQQALKKLFPPLPSLGEDPPYPPGPDGRPLTLADLQKLALANSPLIKQAVARVDEAKGNALQAGLWPNPNVGYEGDTMGTTGGPGYQGGWVEQLIKTANKLQLARASAAADLRSAEVDLFKAQTDLATRVRGYYFGLLVAEQSVKLNRALVTFTTEIYRNQVELVEKGGFAAAYEPMYLRSLAWQARAALVAGRNRRTSAWKQLAASLGLPGMPPTQVAGRIDVPVPVLDYERVLQKVMSRHSNFRSAEAAVQKAQFDLELAKRTPIPDVDVRFMLQKDRTGPPYELAPSLSVSVPVPVWNRNQGGILQAQAGLARTMEEAHRVRSDLQNTLADAFERYETNRALLAIYRDRVLPDLVEVYRGVYTRYRFEPPPAGDRLGGAPAPGTVQFLASTPNLGDVVVAQQNLAGAVANYITTLGLVWQAVVDVVDLLQTPDLFGVEAHMQPVAEVPDLDHLPGLPCHHPCSPGPNLHQQMLDRQWPSADRGTTPRTQTLPPPVEDKSDKK